MGQTLIILPQRERHNNAEVKGAIKLNEVASKLGRHVFKLQHYETILNFLLNSS